MDKKSKNKRLIIFTIVCILLSLAFSFLPDLYRNTQKGEFSDLVIDNKPTIYFLYEEPLNNEKVNTLNYSMKTLISKISSKYDKNVSFKMIKNSDLEIDTYKDKFRADKIPCIVLINKRGYITAYFDSLVDANSITYMLDQMI